MSEEKKGFLNGLFQGLQRRETALFQVLTVFSADFRKSTRSSMRNWKRFSSWETLE